MKRFVLYGLLGGMLPMAACTGTSNAPATTASDIAATEAALTAADQTALAYTTLPPCPTAAPVCAAPATKAKIKADAQTAYTAVMAVRQATAAGEPAALAAAQAALTLYLADIPKPAN